jgi:hypothetical protein
MITHKLATTTSNLGSDDAPDGEVSCAEALPRSCLVSFVISGTALLCRTVNAPSCCLVLVSTVSAV